jgi:hypothetical protein
MGSNSGSKTGTKKVGRDAGNGKFVSAKNVKDNKATTVTQTVKASGGKKKPTKGK